MTRSAQDRINDIRAAVDAIRKFEQSGREDGMVFDAVRMRLLEIGEAVNGLPSLCATLSRTCRGSRSSACVTGRPTGTSTPFTPRCGRPSIMTSTH